MFEKALLARTRRSPWSWGGLVIQAGVVSALVIVPMVRPEIIAVMLPKTMISVPQPTPPPVDVEVQQTAQASSSASPVAAVRRPVKPLLAPSNHNFPVALIADPTDAPFIPIGGGTAQADFSSPYVGVITNTLPTAPPPPPERKPEASKPVKVGGLVKPPTIVFRVNPAYPPLAKAARIQGVVKLEGIIAKNGAIVQLKVISGHPSLVKASLDAVAQWRYTPTLLNGEPVDVIAPIDVNFILSN